MKKTLGLSLVAIVLGFTAACDSLPGSGEKEGAVEVDVNSKGGSATSSDGKVHVTIPSDAVDGEGVLRIKKLDASNGPTNSGGPAVAYVGDSYDISLDGTNLTSTAEIRFDGPSNNEYIDDTGIKRKYGTIIRHVESSNKWIVPLQYYDNNDDEYVVKTSHFSHWMFQLFEPWGVPKTVKWRLASLPSNVAGDVGREEVEREISLAFNKWERETKKVGLRFEKVSKKNSSDITLTFGDMPIERQVKEIFTNDADAYTSVDHETITFNDDIGWVLSDRTSGSNSIAEVAIHEVGHAIGLGHPCDCTEPPRMAANADNEKSIYLSEGDISLVKDRYDIPENEAPESGIVAHYPFEGSVEDKSGESNDGLIKGNVSFPKGVDEKSAKFGGFGDRGYIRVLNDPSLVFDGEATFSMWVRLDDSFGQTGANCTGNGTDNANQVLLAKSGDRVGFVLFSKINKNGKVRVRSKMSDASISNESIAGTAKTTNVDEKEWFHLVHVMDQDGTRIYVNGEKISEDSRPADFSVANDENMYLGLQRGKGSCLDYWWPLNGALDQVRVYNRSLEEDEIRNLYLE